MTNNSVRFFNSCAVGVRVRGIRYYNKKIITKSGNIVVYSEFFLKWDILIYKEESQHVNICDP